jgi:hypothetical protein
MLDNTGTRQLAYVVIVDNVTAIPGYDRVELAHVGGWTIVVGKGEFKAGDPAIYFEIDSQLPEVEPFTNMEFLAKKHYKIKTQKMCKSLSQGLLMSAANFGWEAVAVDGYVYIKDKNNIVHFVDNDSRFLTEQLGVTYAVPEDNTRKAASADKYKLMARRHGKLFAHQPFRWLMQRDWGKKLLFFFFGRKRDKRAAWPAWVQKTDEERVQNIPYILNQKGPWIATEKIDGTSTTFTMKRHKGIFGTQYEFLVCSRNVVFDKPDKKCFYETNVYTEMAEKYDIENVLKKMLTNDFPDAEWVTIQGETYGAGIQNRDYCLAGHDFYAFNLVVDGKGRLGSLEGRAILDKYQIPWVPVLDDHFMMPDTVDELLAIANGVSAVDELEREGIVFRTPDGKQSFKAVSNAFLLKYHS